MTTHTPLARLGPLLQGAGLTPPARPDGPRAPGLSLMTVNIHKGFTPLNRRFILPSLRQAIHEVGADVVLLQEVHGRHDGHHRRVRDWPPMPHYEFLADSVWRDHAYGRNSVYPEGDHGNAVLSRFPILHAANHDVSAGGPERRGLLHCVLDTPGPRGPLHVVCVHLSLLESRRQRQLRQLQALLAGAVPPQAPLVVAGDFNDWRLRAEAPLRRMGLHEVHQAHGQGLPRTFPARFPVLRLDRIYVRNATRQRPIDLHGQPWPRLSDHRPLAAWIEA